MTKIILFTAIGLIVGFTFLANISGATQFALSYLGSWFDKEKDFYQLVSNLFVLASHPIWQVFIYTGVLIMGIRVMFIR